LIAEKIGGELSTAIPHREEKGEVTIVSSFIGGGKS